MREILVELVNRWLLLPGFFHRFCFGRLLHFGFRVCLWFLFWSFHIHRLFFRLWLLRLPGWFFVRWHNRLAFCLWLFHRPRIFLGFRLWLIQSELFLPVVPVFGFLRTLAIGVSYRLLRFRTESVNLVGVVLCVFPDVVCRFLVRLVDFDVVLDTNTIFAWCFLSRLLCFFFGSGHLLLTTFLSLYHRWLAGLLCCLLALGCRLGLL